MEDSEQNPSNRSAQSSFTVKKELVQKYRLLVSKIFNNEPYKQSCSEFKIVSYTTKKMIVFCLKKNCIVCQEEYPHHGEIESAFLTKRYVIVQVKTQSNNFITNFIDLKNGSLRIKYKHSEKISNIIERSSQPTASDSSTQNTLQHKFVVVTYSNDLKELIIDFSSETAKANYKNLVVKELAIRKQTFSPKQLVEFNGHVYAYNANRCFWHDDNTQRYYPPHIQKDGSGVGKYFMNKKNQRNLYVLPSKYGTLALYEKNGGMFLDWFEEDISQSSEPKKKEFGEIDVEELGEVGMEFVELLDISRFRKTDCLVIKIQIGKSYKLSIIDWESGEYLGNIDLESDSNVHSSIQMVDSIKKNHDGAVIKCLGQEDYYNNMNNFVHSIVIREDKIDIENLAKLFKFDDNIKHFDLESYQNKLDFEFDIKAITNQNSYIQTFQKPFVELYVTNSKHFIIIDLINSKNSLNNGYQLLDLETLFDKVIKENIEAKITSTRLAIDRLIKGNVYKHNLHSLKKDYLDFVKYEEIVVCIYERKFKEADCNRKENRFRINLEADEKSLKLIETTMKSISNFTHCLKVIIWIIQNDFFNIYQNNINSLNQSYNDSQKKVNSLVELLFVHNLRGDTNQEMSESGRLGSNNSNGILQEIKSLCTGGLCLNLIVEYLPDLPNNFVKDLFGFADIRQRNLLMLYLQLDMKSLYEEQKDIESTKTIYEIIMKYRSTFEVSDYLYSVALGFQLVDKMIKASQLEDGRIIKKQNFSALARKSCYLLAVKEIDTTWQRRIIYIYYLLGMHEMFYIYTRCCSLKWLKKENYELYLTIFLETKKVAEAYTFYDYGTRNQSIETRNERFEYYVSCLIDRKMLNELQHVQYDDLEREIIKTKLKSHDTGLYIKCLIYYNEIEKGLEQYENQLTNESYNRLRELDLLIRIRVINSTRMFKMVIIKKYPRVFQGGCQIMSEIDLNKIKGESSNRMNIEDKDNNAADFGNEFVLDVVKNFIDNDHQQNQIMPMEPTKNEAREYTDIIGFNNDSQSIESNEDTDKDPQPTKNQMDIEEAGNQNRSQSKRTLNRVCNQYNSRSGMRGTTNLQL